LFGGLFWAIAWAAELSSLLFGIPFGFYQYTGLTRGQELYVTGVPCFSSLSFAFLAYAAYCLTRGVLARFPASTAVRAVLTGFLMMMLDVVIDPVAVRGDRWFLGDLFSYPGGGVYFGVPLSNFAGWWLVGAIGIFAYEACVRTEPASGPGRIGVGIALYYAVFVFNLAVTGWIGEWTLVVVGLAIHTLMAVAIVVIARRAPERSVLGTREAEGV
jgi:putative membrane protein